MKTYIVSLLFLVSISITSLTSCAPKMNKNEMDKSKAASINYTEVLRESHSNYEQQQILSITSQSQLQQLYATINATRRPGFVLPEVDFDKHIIVAAILGSKNSGGYTIEIDKVKELKDHIQLLFTASSPQAGQPVTMALTSPILVVQLNNNGKKVKASFRN